MVIRDYALAEIHAANILAPFLSQNRISLIFENRRLFIQKIEGRGRGKKTPSK